MTAEAGHRRQGHSWCESSLGDMFQTDHEVLDLQTFSPEAGQMLPRICHHCTIMSFSASLICFQFSGKHCLSSRWQYQKNGSSSSNIFMNGKDDGHPYFSTESEDILAWAAVV